jgi:3-oxoacyl-[acyl-carrier protein] reductase
MKNRGAAFDFFGAHILVTGGTSGIGLATASAFAASGAEVTVTGTKASSADYDIDLAQFHYIQMIAEAPASIDAAAEALARCDVLINNAGVSFYPLGLDERDPDVFDRSLAINLSAPYRLAQKLADKLAQSNLPGGGSVINIGSVTSLMGMAATLGYGTSKTGLLGMTRGLAVDLGAQGIRVNMVAAGMVRTRMTAAVFEGSEWLAPTLARTPLGRLGEPDDIAGPVLFLCSDLASWITGQVLMVDGGYTIHG